jgi:hypothetical protein
MKNSHHKDKTNERKNTLKMAVGLSDEESSWKYKDLTNGCKIKYIRSHDERIKSQLASL